MISNFKKTAFLIEGFTTFAVVYYSNYLFFYMKQTFGFGDFENLLLAALNGIVYATGSWQGGRFAQKFGNITSVATGLSGMIIALATGLLFSNLSTQICIYVLWTVSVCLIWPALEAIISDGEHEQLSSMIGRYNVTWACTSAISYFVTGILLENLGIQSLFWLPLTIHISQLLLLVPLAMFFSKKEITNRKTSTVEASFTIPEDSRRFLHMAWLANPFSYVAISTIIPLIPSIAGKTGLSTANAGVICSVWMFARLTAFFVLWKWNGWHYRFRWLAGSFLSMIVAFAGILCANSVFILILAQIAFGLSIGIIYYSSLYYSMLGSEEKGAHGGLHEAMIGSGLFVGPAFGAICLYLLPSLSKNSGMPINVLLTIGFISLAWLGRFRVSALKNTFLPNDTYSKKNKNIVCK